MARWFWWFAATLVVTLLFVRSDCLRKPVNENVSKKFTFYNKNLQVYLLKSY